MQGQEELFLKWKILEIGWMSIKINNEWQIENSGKRGIIMKRSSWEHESQQEKGHKWGQLAFATSVGRASQVVQW